VLTVNVAVEDPAATVTLAGMVNALKPVQPRLTTAPVAGTAFESITVQVLLALGPRAVELHCSEVIVAGDTTLMLAACEIPL
jgi:hypothetical protein